MPIISDKLPIKLEYLFTSTSALIENLSIWLKVLICPRIPYLPERVKFLSSLQKLHCDAVTELPFPLPDSIIELSCNKVPRIDHPLPNQLQVFIGNSVTEFTVPLPDTVIYLECMSLEQFPQPMPSGIQYAICKTAIIDNIKNNIPTPLFEVS